MPVPNDSGRIHLSDKPMFYINRWDVWTYNPLNDPVEITRAKRRRLDAEREEQMDEDKDRPDPVAIIETLFPTHDRVSPLDLQGDFQDDCSDCEQSAPNEGPDDNFAQVHLDDSDDEEDRAPCDCFLCSFSREGNFELRHVVSMNPRIFDGTFHEYMEEVEHGAIAADEEESEDDDEDLEDGKVREPQDERMLADVHESITRTISRADNIWLQAYADRLRQAMERREVNADFDAETAHTLHEIGERAQQAEETGTFEIRPGLLNWAQAVIREHEGRY